MSKEQANHPGMFGYLATRLSAHPENIATEALSYVLRSSTAAARAFEDYLRRAAPLPTGLHYVTQSSGEDGAIPDLVGLAADGTSPLVLEAKFWAGLTDNQPVTYLGRLPVGDPAVLLFVVPSVRVELLWTEVLGRTAAAGLEIATLPDASEYRQARLADGRVLAMTSWRALLTTLRASAIEGGDRSAVSNLDQLAGLSERMDSQAFVPLSGEDLSGSVGLRLQQYTDLINRAIEHLVAAGVASTKTLQGGGLYNSAAAEWWGRYFALDGVICLLRFAAGPWARDRATPIWLQIGYKGDPSVPAVLDALAPLRAEPNRVFARSTFVDVAIDLPTRQELDAVVVHMAAQIGTIASYLHTLRMLPGVEAAAPPSSRPDDGVSFGP